MKYTAIYISLGLVTVFLLWKGVQQPAIASETPVGVQWNDTLFKHLPCGMDTNVMVMDTNGRMIKFGQYIKPVFNYDATIYQDRGIWKLHWISKTRFTKPLNGVSPAILNSWRMVDTIKDWHVKLNAIARTLAQADYVLVLKSEHKMLVGRKGKTLLSFPINMGWAPVGNKAFDGDGKTPEGIYHLEMKALRGDKFYKSFLISYPDERDMLIAKEKGLKPGSGVCIHGTPAEREGKRDWTAGCIALSNKDIDTLFEHVASGTIIEIRK